MKSNAEFLHLSDWIIDSFDTGRFGRLGCDDFQISKPFRVKK